LQQITNNQVKAITLQQRSGMPYVAFRTPTACIATKKGTNKTCQGDIYTYFAKHLI